MFWFCFAKQGHHHFLKDRLKGLEVDVHLDLTVRAKMRFACWVMQHWGSGVRKYKKNVCGWTVGKVVPQIKLFLKSHLANPARQAFRPVQPTRTHLRIDNGVTTEVKGADWARLACRRNISAAHARSHPSAGSMVRSTSWWRQSVWLDRINSGALRHEGSGVRINTPRDPHRTVLSGGKPLVEKKRLVINVATFVSLFPPPDIFAPAASQDERTDERFPQLAHWRGLLLVHLGVCGRRTPR